MSEEKIKVLESFGFTQYSTDCELLYAFKNTAYGLDTKMLVQGDHATDCAELIYAEEEGFEGLCYCGSLMEYLMVNYSDHGIDKILKKIAKVTYIDYELAFVGIYPMIVLRCDDTTFTSGIIRYEISDMLKLIGIVYYNLQP